MTIGMCSKCHRPNCELVADICIFCEPTELLVEVLMEPNVFGNNNYDDRSKINVEGATNRDDNLSTNAA